MNAPYKTKAPTIYDLLEEIEAGGRSRSAACTELSNMIRDRAVVLFDMHRPSQSDEWLIDNALDLIGAFRLNALTATWASSSKRHSPFIEPSRSSANVGARCWAGLVGRWMRLQV